MRTRNLLAFASTITGIILLASCSEQKAWQDGTISPLGGKYPLRLSANVEQVQSRSTGKDAWTGGEEIGVILESQTGKYYITDASGNVEAIDESNTLYWPHTAKAEVKGTHSILRHYSTFPTSRRAMPHSTFCPPKRGAVSISPFTSISVTVCRRLPTRSRQLTVLRRSS